MQVRRAKAIGVLADPQHALDLHATAELAADGTIPAQRPHRTGTTSGPTIHVHLHTDAIATFTDPASHRLEGGCVARVTRLGARSVAAVEQWLADLAPGARVTITPVVDLTEQISVDAYEVPDRLRAHMAERDLGCRFPWCGRQGRHDLDHIDPYVPTDDGGPPGQTSSANLARLCRFHHRVKTHSRVALPARTRRHPDLDLTAEPQLHRRRPRHPSPTTDHDAVSPSTVPGALGRVHVRHGGATSARTTDAEGVEDPGPAIKDASNHPVLVVCSGRGLMGAVREPHVAAAVVVDDHAGEIPVVAVRHHPAWAEVSGAAAAGVSGRKVVQGGLKPRQVIDRNRFRVPVETPPVRGATAGRLAYVEGVVTAHPCLLRLEERGLVVRGVLGAEAVTGRVVTRRQFAWAGSVTGGGELVRSDLWGVRDRGAGRGRTACADNEDGGRKAEAAARPAPGARVSADGR